MTASIPDLILSLPGWAALGIVFLLPALESSAFLGFLFPGEIAVILGGVLASRGTVPLGAVIAAAIVGAVVGDSIGYAVGRRWGHRMLHGTLGHLPIIRHELAKHLDTASVYVRKRGPHAVFIGRFTAALRVLVPGLAGMAELPYPTFLLFNVLGAIAWGTTFVLLGYLAGASWHRVAADAGHIGLALLALLLLGVVAARVLRSVRNAGIVLTDRLAALRPARWVRKRFPGPSAWLARRIDPASPTGFPLSVAIVGAALAVWLFGSMLEDVQNTNEAALRDPGITSWVVAHRVGWVTAVLKAVSVLASNAVLIPLVAAIGFGFSFRGRVARPLVQLTAALSISILAYTASKELVDRARPPVTDWLVGASGSSFPSGHSADAAAVLGMLAVIALAGRSFGARVGIVLVAVAGCLLVASSRVYLGVHWFTDTIAGLALGWSAVAIVSAVTLLLTSRGDERAPEPVPEHSHQA
jgi:membrane protein DedA with SNARE-associated domain/membrane-associated phospholipid phosphatase